MRAVFVATFCCFVVALNAQPKKYKLIVKQERAEFNYRGLRLIDTSLRVNPQIFKPVKGRHTVYTFIATFEGNSYTGRRKTFHDILIIKTNSRGRIKDAYQYTLEWSEIPSYDLYKAHAKKLYLTTQTTIAQMRFTRVNSSGKGDRQLNDDGILSFTGE